MKFGKFYTNFSPFHMYSCIDFVQTGPGAHPASCTVGTGSFLGVKRPEHGADPRPHLAPRLKKE